MENAEDAEKMGEYCKEKTLKFNGNRLMVYVSRKYRQLKHGSGSSSVVESSRCCWRFLLQFHPLFVQTSISQHSQEGQLRSLSSVLQTS